MDITDVRVKIIGSGNDRLKAYCTVTLDGDFVVRDLKVVDGTNGLFVAMPSRKRSSPCPTCRHKNHLRAKYCNECGAKLRPVRVPHDANGRPQLHRDVAHPINTDFRQLVQDRVVEAYLLECDRAQDPNYRPTHDDHFGDDGGEYDAMIADLDSGAADAPSGEGHASDGGPRRDRGGESRSGARRPRRDGRRGGPRREPERVSEAEVERAPAETADDAEAHAPDEFGAELDIAPPEEQTMAAVGAPNDDAADRERVEEADTGAPSGDANDDSAAFGAGIVE